MFALIKLIQSILGALHSEGRPGQLALGIALGSIMGLTPLMNIHNAIVFAAIVLLNVSFGGGMLGWALFVPIGFLLDPLFDWIGHQLLMAESLRGLWTSLYNTPIVPLTNFNNTVVLGSLVFALLLLVPLFFATRWAVARYRATIGERVRQSKFYRAVMASKVYNVYRMFQP
ncbi:MAG TPA: TIGR03546 family protein [Gemmatimonadales bacterium]|nr:TIGR03546 family protein [Gemmatimonadales bacterium]